MTDTELAALYAQYGYLVHRRCLAIVRNRADAEDALQETFLRVRRYGNAQSTGSTLAWLYTIASRCCFDLMERKGRERPADDDELRAFENVGQGSSEDPDRRALVGAALRTLDGTTRTIGVLHYLDGFTQEEVAERTGYSRKTVGKKLKHFESLLRRALFGGAREETS